VTSNLLVVDVAGVPLATVLAGVDDVVVVAPDTESLFVDLMFGFYYKLFKY